MDEEELKKQLFNSIVDSFNKVGMMAMNQLANGNDGFTISNGPWTVTLDLEGFLERGGKAEESHSQQEISQAKKAEIIERLVKPWHDNLRKTRKENNNEME